MAESAGSATHMIEAHGVCKSFGETEVLKNVDLTVNRGEVVVVIGPSGSGKTTLIRTFNGLETINAGRIVVDDITLQDATVLDGSVVDLDSVLQVPASARIDLGLIERAIDAAGRATTRREQHSEPALPRWRAWRASRS